MIFYDPKVVVYRNEPILRVSWILEPHELVQPVLDPLTAEGARRAGGGGGRARCREHGAAIGTRLGGVYNNYTSSAFDLQYPTLW